MLTKVVIFQILFLQLILAAKLISIKHISINADFGHYSSIESKSNVINEDLCGKVLESRIVGGTEAQPYQYPWMAALVSSSTNKFICGATVIAKRYVVTAAHCLIRFDGSVVKPYQLKVRLGAHRINDQGSIDFGIEQLALHDKYDHATYDHDVAVIKLNSDIDYNRAIKPICVTSKSSSSFVDSKATVIGWGVTEEGVASDVLKQAELRVWSNDECARSYGHRNISDDVMCASAPGKDACQSDSGGPLMIRDDSNQWTLIGIVSWGRGCAQKEFPGVYTRVSQYVELIREKLKSI